jgi:SOS-response transcriptional repressor LexA
MPLTPKQEQFYNLLKLYFDRFGKAPSNEELRQWLEENNWGEGAPIKSIRSVTQYLDALEKLGKIRREPHRSRGITLMERPFDAT